MTSVAGKGAFEPDKDDPWKGDKLERKRFAEALKPILSDLDSPATIGLIGGWGAGKTNFLKRLRADLALQDDSPAVVYFDAWARDFSDDPFASFCAAIHEELKHHEGAREVESQTNLRKKTLAVLGTVGASVIRAIGASAGAIAAANVGADPAAGALAADKGMEKLLEKAAEKTAEVAAKKMQEATDKAPDARKEFRDALGKVVAALSASESAQVGKCRLLIVVDELDRCRPDYAIRLLETIKHFFDVQGVTFLLAYDDEYMASAAKALYGQAFEAEQYLRKFVDVRFWLPSVDQAMFVRDLVKHYGIKDAFGGQVRKGNDMENSLVSFLLAMNLSLRDAEQALAQCRLLLGRIAGRVDSIYVPCMFLTIARFAIPETVQRAIDGELPFDKAIMDVQTRFEKHEFFSSFEWKWLKAQFLFSEKNREEVGEFINSPGAAIETRNAIAAAVNALHRYPWGDAWREYLNFVR